MKKVGLIINPIAGIGGKLGLKGTDGYTLEELKNTYGAESVSLKKATQALKPLLGVKESLRIITYGGDMGEHVARDLFKDIICVGMPESNITTEGDTIEALRRIVHEGVDILMFVGGDGTARNVFQAIGNKQVCIGVPSGVKMHSGVHGLTPSKAGELARDYLNAAHMRTCQGEVMDIDEALYREGKVFAKLFGYLTIPVDRKKTQNKKSGTNESQRYFQDAIACHIIENIMEEDTYYIIGPGTTTAQIQRRLKQPYTLLGVDIIYQGKTVAKDLNERDLLKWIEGRKTKLIITPTGGQGFLLGRGNQQISSSVIRQLGKENIYIIATKDKLSSIGSFPLYIDLEEDCNNMLRGYHKIIAGFDEVVLKKITD